MVMICLRLRLFSISARRVARGDGDLSDMVASVSVKQCSGGACAAIVAAKRPQPQSEMLSQRRHSAATPADLCMTFAIIHHICAKGKP
jgi:hypothetical protein